MVVVVVVVVVVVRVGGEATGAVAAMGDVLGMYCQ